MIRKDLGKKGILAGIVLPAAILAMSLAACSSKTEQTAAPAETAPAAEAVQETVEEAAGNEEAAAEATAEAAEAAVVETAVEDAAAGETAAAEAAAEEAAAGGTAAAETAAEEAATAETAAAATVAEETIKVTNGDFVLSIPAQYEELLVINDAPENGMLFSVSEKASIEAGKVLGYEAEEDGLGWLFGIGVVSEEEGHERMCSDMSGEDIFAHDESGNYYILYHPTDVRLVRETNEQMTEAMDQWSALNEWAGSVPATFIAENEGLVAEKHTNTALDIYLAHIAYKGDLDFTLSALGLGPIEISGVGPMPFIEDFLNKVTFEYADGEAPEGECVSLGIPQDGVRYDFFFADGNYVREVRDDGFSILYRAVFEDETLKVTDIMNDFFNSMIQQ